MPSEIPLLAQPDTIDPDTDAIAPGASGNFDDPRIDRPRGRPWKRYVAAGLVLGLIGVFATFGLIERATVESASSTARNRSAAIAAASAEVVTLTTVSATGSSVDIARLLAGAAPSFKSQFEADASTFESALQAAHVTSKGVVDSAGLVSLKGNQAAVLVAATGTVTNNQTKTPDPRTYRINVSLQKIAGKWLVSQMSFVA